jgi:hypothetical protein
MVALQFRQGEREESWWPMEIAQEMNETGRRPSAPARYAAD